MVRNSMRGDVGRDLRNAWGFARAVPRRGTWARETVAQALKAGTAAVLAWFVAAHVLDLPQPYLAPWVALVVVRPTVHWSLLTGLRQVAAVALGVLVAVAAVTVMPGKELALAVGVPVAFLLSYWPRLDDQGSYVAFTAMFMIAVDSVEEPFALFRLLETGLGAVIGMGVNLLIAPPYRVLTLDARTRQDAAAAADLLRAVATELREGSEAEEDAVESRARRLDERVAETGAALRHARDGLRLNPRRGEARVQDSVERADRALDLVRRVGRAGHALADLLDDERREDMPSPPSDRGFREASAAVVEAAADAVGSRAAALLSGDDPPESEDLSAALKELDGRGGDGPVTEAQSALRLEVRRIALAATR